MRNLEVTNRSINSVVDVDGDTFQAFEHLQVSAEHNIYGFDHLVHNASSVRQAFSRDVLKLRCLQGTSVCFLYVRVSKDITRTK